MAKKSLVRKSEQSELLSTPKTPFKRASSKRYDMSFTPFSLSQQQAKREKQPLVKIKGAIEQQGAYEILCSLGTVFITKDKYLGKYDILEKCGEGSFMTAYMVKRNGLVTCLKVSNKPYKGKIDRENRLKEVEILYKLASPFVTKIVRAWEQDSLLYIELEYCGPTLSRIINEKCFNKKSRFERKMIYRLMYEVGQGLLELHSLGYVHNDIKPENIFCDKKNFKIGDFNISREEGLIDEDGDKKYMAPEILGGRCTIKSDVYSLGLIFAELICNVVLPTSGKEWIDLRQNKFKSLSVPAKHQSFLFQMLHESPPHRPSMKEVVGYFEACLRTKK